MDEFATYDAAYVLGALAPQERQAFEEHLQGCPRCAAAVRELAGLPGLLAQARESGAGSGGSGGAGGSGSGGDSGAGDGGSAGASGAPGVAGPPGSWGEEPPPDLLPSLLRRVRRRRRIRRAATGGMAGVAVAAGVALVVSLTVPGAAPSPSPSPSPEAPALAMSALGEYPIQAAARVEGRPWGTEVEMSCTYGGGRSGDYSLVAISRDGTETRIATWQALPANTAKVAVGTAMQPGDIHVLEIRTVLTGKPLMRLVYP